MSTEILKLKAGSYLVPVTISKEGERLFLKFGYNKMLLEEVRMMERARWHGYDENNPRKMWSIADSPRNRFQLSYLAYPDPKDPRNPYYHYDKPLIEFTPQPRTIIKHGKEIVVKPYNHQVDLIRQGLTYHYTVFGAEMGTGKTLSAIIVMEESGVQDWLWVGPKAALHSVQLEFRTWRAKVIPKFLTYEGLVKLIENWPEGKKPPQGVIFDESSRCKNPTAKRTQAAMHLAFAIRQEWGESGFVIEMSGSPAPKSPVDWWSQCEIACPGFLREGNVDKFKKRLAVIEEREAMAGGVYPHLVTWKDDPKKCDKCGLLATDPRHDSMNMVDDPKYHPFVASKDEISYLYKRMKGLVMVKFKKDCLDLPEKQYRLIRLKPSQSTLNAAKLLEAKSGRAITALTLLRELSDGFQYSEKEEGVEECPHCHGTKSIDEQHDRNRPDELPSIEEIEKGYRFEYDPNSGEIIPGDKLDLHTVTVACPTCNGVGTVAKTIRTAVQVACPKETATRDILDEHEEVGRIVIFGGFTGTIDRVCEICKSAGWSLIRVDGRGWWSDIPGGAQELLQAFQERKDEYPRVAFVGQPGAAGMGLNLTASPTILYYSNDFNAESRIQSEDRIHRPGMDHNRGATIIDLIHLPTDQLILDNLKKKRKLQNLTMGEVNEIMKAALVEDRVT